MNNTQIIPGSISAIAQQSGRSIAELFTNADVVVIVDVSGSMASKDSMGKSRYEVACSELASLQNAMPGKVAVIAFSDRTEFCPAGVPLYQGGGTNLVGALRYAKIADVSRIKIILISDGEPNDQEQSINEARKFRNKINVIYVGPENKPAGREFLYKLAAATGGQSITADRAIELSKSIQQLLLKA